MKKTRWDELRGSVETNVHEDVFRGLNAYIRQLESKKTRRETPMSDDKKHDVTLGPGISPGERQRLGGVWLKIFCARISESRFGLSHQIGEETDVLFLEYLNRWETERK